MKSKNKNTKNDTKNDTKSTYVTCFLCDKQFKRITHTHLTNKHNLSLDDYIEMFPSADLLSNNLRAKFSTNNETFWIIKHGIDRGKEIWNSVCQQKVHNLQNFITRYGINEGLIKFHNWINNLQKPTSKGERQFVDYIINLNLIDPQLTIYSYRTKQFYKWDHISQSAMVYDFVVPSLKCCIEYHGDYWHCNPKKYNADYIRPSGKLSAKAIWDHDYRKQQVIEEAGYTYLAIWESNWKHKKDDCIQRIKTCLTQT